MFFNIHPQALLLPNEYNFFVWPSFVTPFAAEQKQIQHKAGKSYNKTQQQMHNKTHLEIEQVIKSRVINQVG